MLSRFLNKFHFTLGLGFILNFIVSGGKTQIQGYAQLSSTKLSDISRNNPNDPVVGLGAIQSLAPQAHQSSLTPTMFHYQMYPQVHSPSAFKAGKRKRCIMTENGMKCKHRRDGQDSYLMAAGDSGHASSYGDMTSGGWGWPAEEEEGGGGSLDLLGLLGLVGLKGLKGWKGLTGLATLVPFLPFLLPFLLPLILPILALPLVAIGAKLLLTALAVLFVPIPVVVGTRSYDFELDHNFLKNVSLSNFPSIVGNVLNSEECLERIVCEVARRGWMEKFTSIQFQKGVTRKASNKPEIEVALDNRIDTGLDTNAKDCTRFRCTPEFILKSNATEGN